MIRRFEIYQLDNVEENRKRFFVRSEHQRTLGLDPAEGVYKKMWEDRIVCIENKDIKDILESIYSKFNLDRPKGFMGHSPSISDIIKLDGVCWYIEPYGFSRIEMRGDGENEV